MKQIRAFIEKQGFFVLLAVCISVIAGSGLWALSMRDTEEGVRAGAQGGQSQSLSDAERLRMAAPVAGEIARGFGQTQWLDTLRYWSAHEAVDIRAQKGEPVRAAKDGMVDAVYRDGRLGGIVEITHGNGLSTRYCALAWPVAVTVGEKVISGQTLGSIGTAPMEASDGTHLHFEVWLDGEPVDPGLCMG